jgi:hypothetical protein
MKSGEKGLVRDTDSGDMLELLFLIAVATILINRTFLALTGYPRIAFGSLHIAHMLWGGLLMLVSLVMVFHYWNPSIRRLAAFISGIGFGLFIDELGKFITSDNDYFFKPTIAIIYVIFVTMYLIFRRLAESRPISEREIKVNEAIRRDLKSGFDMDSYWLKSYDYIRNKSVALLKRILAIPSVIPVVMILFVFTSLSQFAAIFGWISPGWIPTKNVSGLSLIGGFSSSVLVLTGLLVLKSSRKKAVHWFKRAILVNIFVTQVFLFYQSQLTAIWGLIINLLVYACIIYYLRHHPDEIRVHSIQSG